jgi:hypothetical protein
MTHHHHHHHLLRDIAVGGALAFGAYEMYHLQRYGNFGIGDPNHHGISFGSPFGYGGPGTGYGGLGAGYGGPGTGYYY